MPNYFKRLYTGGWRQFETIDIGFHDRMTILTGANGAGKTALLRILSRHFGASLSELRTPDWDKISGSLRYHAPVHLRQTSFDDTPERTTVIGKLQYETAEGIAGAQILLLSPTGPRDVTYRINLSPQVLIEGLMISSHRSVFRYTGESSLSLSPTSTPEWFDTYRSISLRSIGGENWSPMDLIKQTLLEWGIYSGRNSALRHRPESKENFEAFSELLRDILPIEIGFKSLEVRSPEVVLKTDSGDFMLDAVSGGIAALFELVWPIFLFDPARRKAITVAIDEPENHLHPSLQRTLLNTLMNGFPQVRFVIATHSPLIVGSVENSSVYALRFNSFHRVESELLDFSVRSGTANEILREVLGVGVTSPVWVERQIDDLVRRFSTREMSDELLKELRSALLELGFGEYVPSTIAQVAASNRKASE
ncbi:hypothetical protein BH09CHL1_BH09CHL1_09810 [soil metagenome]